MSEELERLTSVLIQCFALVLAGYVSGRTGLISSSESKGLATFVTYFSLPALIFVNLVTINLSNISWAFVSAIFVSKTLVFVATAAVVLILTKPTDTALAGIFAIFCTQSNDFAMGYPIFSSLYETSHPTFPNYLYILAPIQLVILNPIGLFMMEIQKQWQQQKKDHHRHGKSSLFLPLLKGISTNPIIIMTVLGLFWNLSLSNEIPSFLKPLIQVLADSFSAVALFLLGLNMVGNFVMFRGTLTLLLPIVLVIVKIVILPLVIWFVTEYIFTDRTCRSTASLGYLYGTIPSAPTVFIFALQYGLETDAITTGMVLSTILSAPIMFVTANMIRMAEKTDQQPMINLSTTIVYVSAISIPCVIWTLVVFVMNKRWKTMAHAQWQQVNTLPAAEDAESCVLDCHSVALPTFCEK